MMAAGMILKKTFKGLKNENNIWRLKKNLENSCIKKQTEDTSGQKAQRTNSEKKQQNFVFLHVRCFFFMWYRHLELAYFL